MTLPEGVKILAPDAAAEYISTLSEANKDSVRRQVHQAASDLNEEWMLLNMLGLEK